MSLPRRIAQTPSRLDNQDAALLVLLSILWGLSFTFTGIAVRELPPLTIVLIRVTLASLLLVPVMMVRRAHWPASLSAWTPFLVMALINNVIPFTLQVMAQKHITSGLASVLNATAPLFTVLVMAAACEEALSAHRLVGVGIGIAGVMILRDPTLSLDGDQSIGILMCLGATLSYGFSGLWGRRHLSATPPLTAATCQLICSSLMMAGLAAAIETPWHLAMPGPHILLALLGLAALSTALAYIVFFRILTRSGATNVMLVTLLIPITALAIGHLALGETVTSRQILGAVVIGSALLIIDGRVLTVLKFGQQRT